jgi:hypothetical protein
VCYFSLFPLIPWFLSQCVTISTSTELSGRIFPGNYTSNYTTPTVDNTTFRTDTTTTTQAGNTTTQSGNASQQSPDGAQRSEAEFPSDLQWLYDLGLWDEAPTDVSLLNNG